MTSRLRLFALLLLVHGFGVVFSSCGDDETPTPTTPAPPPAPEPPPAPAPLPAPTNVRVTDQGEDFVEWSWDPVEGADGYETLLFRNKEPMYGPPPITFVKEPRWRVDGEPGTKYELFVRAVRGQETGPLSARSVYPPLPVVSCTDAYRYTRRDASEYKLAQEWDGTPFRMDMIDSFPPDAMPGLADRLLDPVEEVADRIEEQLGYRILEVGEVIEPPPGWNVEVDPSYFSGPEGGNRQQPCGARERGQIMGRFMTIPYPGYEGDGSVNMGCVAVEYLRHEPSASWLQNPDEMTSRGHYIDAVTLHELFHLFGLRHEVPPLTDEWNMGGVPMSRELRVARGLPGAEAVQESDIDFLGCVFPHPEFPRR